MPHNGFLHSAEQDTFSSNLAFSWFLTLRWGAISCQILLILAVHLLFSIGIPLLLVSLIVGFQAASNLCFSYLRRKYFHTPEWLFGLVMLLDIVLLSLLLLYTGGAMNPFTFLYLVHIVLGAILMHPRWAWSLTLFAIICYGSFFLPGLFPLGESSHCDSPLLEMWKVENVQGKGHGQLSLHLQGMWFAFSLTSLFIVFCVNSIQGELSKHQRALVRLKEEKDRSDKLASLGNLAAGAAHEFSTPLSIIAVASGEMLRTLRQGEADLELIADAELIRDQVEGCKEILYQMTADAGEHLGEAGEDFLLQELVDEVVTAFNNQYPHKVVLSNLAQEMVVCMPPRTIRRTIRGLLKNASEAMLIDGPINMLIRADNEYLYIEVEDKGIGMDAETLAKTCDPFFTTKEPGKGMGLGLYLTRTLVEKFGGDISMRSEPGKGTTVILSLALEEIRPSV